MEAQNNHQRKKQPEKVKSQLLKATGDIIITRGIEGLTLDAAARKAGVSKGGLLHHFPNKQALLSGVFDHMIEEIGLQINDSMQKDENPHARFTRAYLAMNNATERSQQSQQSQLYMILTLAMMTNTALRQRWLGWFEQQLKKSGSEEEETMAWIVRFAADGLWLSDLTQTPRLKQKQRLAIIEKLLEMTLKGDR